MSRMIARRISTLISNSLLGHAITRSRSDDAASRLMQELWMRLVQIPKGFTCNLDLPKAEVAF